MRDREVGSDTHFRASYSVDILPSAVKVGEGELSEVMLGKVHVDYCGTCHGIFLDRGELEEALVAVQSRDKTMTAQQVVAAAVSVAG